MSKDLEIIRSLESKIGIKLDQIDFDETWTHSGYALDENEKVIGLNLEDLKLSDVDISGIKELKHLKQLWLNNNQLAESDISWIKELKNLTYLSLAMNELSDISGIRNLKNLTGLDLRYNQLSDVNISVIKELKHLEKLWLNNNQLPGLDISSIKELKHLSRINLMDNRISRIPPEILDLGIDIKWEFVFGESGLFLAGNPLESPPVEIVKQGTEAVRNYFKELEIASIRLLESKLLIVGNGDVGKTTLMRKLKDNDFQVELGKEPTTHGINIVPWKLHCKFNSSEADDVNVHFWDFGGQAIYHATHQFFLTKRSLYLFIWEARKEEDEQSFDYWLNIIRLLGAESPVLVVMNKSDIRTKFLDEADFKEKFNNIMGFQQVSCLDGNGIPELTEQIRATLSRMPHLQDKLPKVWMQIRSHLKSKGETTDYISLEDYFKICQKYGLNHKRAEFISDYLHDLGVILHFRSDNLLENTMILNPEWATEAVYKLIDTRAIQENKGRFRFGDLKDIWDPVKYPRDKHPQLIRLMEKFELCFNFTGTDIYIVPELLPPERPSIPLEKYIETGNLHFEYEYDFMPKGIISRFIFVSITLSGKNISGKTELNYNLKILLRW